jgi:hypothetical protein
MKKLLILIWFVVFAIAGKNYCLEEDPRITYIYIDFNTYKDKDYYKPLIKGLKKSLIPHERVKVYFVNMENNDVKEVFNTCVPKLSRKEIEKIKKEGGFYLFGGNPIDTANEDLAFFYSALKKIFIKALKFKEFDLENKSYIELFYNEGDKFETPLNRIIIYSDLLQNSQDFPLKNILNGKFNLKEYQTSFNYSNVFVYFEKKVLKASEFKKLRDFWKYYFEFNKADLKSFNTTLELGEYKYLVRKKYEGVITYPDNSQIHIQLLLSIDNRGEIENGWLILNELDAVPVNGKVTLIKNKPLKAVLKIDGINDKMHLLKNGERLILRFHKKRAEGILKAYNTENIVITPKGNKFTNPQIKIILKEIYDE